MKDEFFELLSWLEQQANEEIKIARNQPFSKEGQERYFRHLGRSQAFIEIKERFHQIVKEWIS